MNTKKDHTFWMYICKGIQKLLLIESRSNKASTLFIDNDPRKGRICDFRCKCGRVQSYAPEGKRGGITIREAEAVGWRKINNNWECPICTGNKAKLFNL